MASSGLTNLRNGASETHDVHTHAYEGVLEVYPELRRMTLQRPRSYYLIPNKECGCTVEYAKRGRKTDRKKKKEGTQGREAYTQVQEELHVRWSEWSVEWRSWLENS